MTSSSKMTIPKENKFTHNRTPKSTITKSVSLLQQMLQKESQKQHRSNLLHLSSTYFPLVDHAENENDDTHTGIR